MVDDGVSVDSSDDDDDADDDDDDDTDVGDIIDDVMLELYDPALQGAPGTNGKVLSISRIAASSLTTSSRYRMMLCMARSRTPRSKAPCLTRGKTISLQ